jgi:hypothetical protein
MSISLFQIKRLSKEKKSSLSDPRYFELKYQHQLFISVGTIIVFLVSFFGWNSLEGIKTNLNKQISEYDKKYDENIQSLEALQVKQSQLNCTIDSTESRITNKQDELNSSVDILKDKFENNTSALNQYFNSAQKKVDSLGMDLDGLSNIIAQNPSIYIVKKKVAGLDNNLSNSIDTIYFKDCIPLRTELPKFKNAPFVISIEAEKSYTGPICNITKDNFILVKSGFGGNEDSLFVYFMILDF